MTTAHEEQHQGHHTERGDGSFSMWQVFIFSLIPLALVFAGVIVGSMHGKDSNMEDFDAAPPPPPAGSPTRAPGSSLFDEQVSPVYTLVFEDGTPFSL